MPHYHYEVDTVDKAAWHALVERFADANVYQAWLVGAARKGEKYLSHLLLKKEGEAVAATVVSHLGNKAMYLFAATSNCGTATGASYVLHWAGLKWLHQRICQWYDLEGVSSRGVQQFKAGPAGKSGAEIQTGDFDACGSAPSRLLVQVGVGVKSRYRDGRRVHNSLQPAAQ